MTTDDATNATIGGDALKSCKGMLVPGPDDTFFALRETAREYGLEWRAATDGPWFSSNSRRGRAKDVVQCRRAPEFRTEMVTWQLAVISHRSAMYDYKRESGPAFAVVHGMLNNGPNDPHRWLVDERTSRIRDVTIDGYVEVIIE